MKYIAIYDIEDKFNKKPIKIKEKSLYTVRKVGIDSDIEDGKILGSTLLRNISETSNSCYANVNKNGELIPVTVGSITSIILQKGEEKEHNGVTFKLLCSDFYYFICINELAIPITMYKSSDKVLSEFPISMQCHDFYIGTETYSRFIVDVFDNLTSIILDKVFVSDDVIAFDISIKIKNDVYSDFSIINFGTIKICDNKCFMVENYKYRNIKTKDCVHKLVCKPLSVLLSEAMMGKYLLADGERVI